MHEGHYQKNAWDGLTPPPDDAPRVDTSVVIGFSIAVVMVLIGALLGEHPLLFLSPGAVLLVVGGTIGATLIQFSLYDLRYALTSARAALFLRGETAHDRMRWIVDLARRVKEQGLLVLEDEAAATSDTCLRLGLELTVDGQKPEDIRRILENELRVSHDRAWRAVQVWESMGNFAPAMGLIGTLIGLIHMLGSLQDPATVGPAMALALVATLYGAASANLIFFPMAGKLRGIAQEQVHMKDITIEGLLSLAHNESAIMLEQRLQSFFDMFANG